MEEKNYRPNVAIIVLSPSYPLECKILVAQRSDIAGAWQFPQGGIDSGETPKDALFRELEEEIGTNKVEIIAEHPEWMCYDFPPNAKKRMAPYDGQKQRYFLVRLKGDAKIDINTKKPEFDDYKFVEQSGILNVVTPFKKDIYAKVIKHFREKGYL